MNKKPKVLMVGEASFLSTGYGTEINHILQHLHGSGKYEVAELGCEASFDDPRQFNVPWTFYNNSPLPGEEQEFASRMINTFGHFRFDQVCLEFKPDYVLNLGDVWMVEWVGRSPYRKYFRWVHRATCDAIPQPAHWISMYMDCDVLLTHSLWGKDVLEKQGGGKIRLGGTPGFGVDTDVFYPMDKSQVRSSLGMDNESFIVGFVARNQSRKLIPELIEGFKAFLKQTTPEQANKSFLYLHTAHPDLGWSIPDILTECGISHKILFTYICQSCGAFFPSFFRDAITKCEACGQLSAITPTTHHALTREQLAVLYNLFDIYVQYATNEGFGAGQVEAAACGLPVFAVDYSAMSDVVRRLKGRPLKVLKLVKQVEFGLMRAVPDENDLVAALNEYVEIPGEGKQGWGALSRQAVLDQFTWDYCCGKWEKGVDSVPPLSYDKGWGSPPNITFPRLIDYSGMSNEEFARWAISDILGMPEKANSYLGLRLVRDLTLGLKRVGVTGSSYINENCGFGMNNGHSPFTREDCIREFLEIREYHNLCEMERCK